MLERNFQPKVIRRLKAEFPGCVVLKTDPNYIQGFPDLLVLYEDRWAALECKRGREEHRQPNQEYYVNLLDEMSYAGFIFPENMEEVFYELQRALRPGR